MAHSMATLRIATRTSPLALRQAEWFSTAIAAAEASLEPVLLPLSTAGDRSEEGGKRGFVKELEQALLAGDADVAVHSMKDVPTALPAGLSVAVVGVRASAADAVVSAAGGLAALAPGARVGTSSPRRQSQLRVAYPALRLVELRGNLHTRLERLERGEVDALVLAAAGLTRLGLRHRIAETLSPSLCLPACGQGALAVEFRQRDRVAWAPWLERLGDPATSACVAAERALCMALETALGAALPLCQLPLGAYAVMTVAGGADGVPAAGAGGVGMAAAERLALAPGGLGSAAPGGGELWLRGIIGNADGTRLLCAEGRGDSPTALGQAVAAALRRRGGDELLRSAP